MNPEDVQDLARHEKIYERGILRVRQPGYYRFHRRLGEYVAGG